MLCRTLGWCPFQGCKAMLSGHAGWTLVVLRFVSELKPLGSSMLDSIRYQQWL